ALCLRLGSAGWGFQGYPGGAFPHRHGCRRHHGHPVGKFRSVLDDAMKILYGVQGTGNGHITRARAMAKELKECGVSVDYLFSGREPDKFFDMEAFGDYRVLRGLTFTSKEGRIRPLATLVNSQPLQFWRDVKSLDLAPYDLVITD